jgi:hypothetical protein
LGAIALAVVARAVPAQTRACPTPSDSSAAVHWGAPLDRPITLHVNEQSLRNALDRLATTAKLKLSYSAEFLRSIGKSAFPRTRRRSGRS